MKKVMLAADLAKFDFDLTRLRYPVYVSPKLDGIRAFVHDGGVYSRNHKLIPNRWVQKMFGNSLFNGVDGELCVGPANDPQVFVRTASGVKSEAGQPEVTFHVFDTMAHTEREYSWRYMKLHEDLNACVGFKVVHQFLADSAAKVRTLEERFLGEGYEGVMIRRPNGMYKHGRSSPTDNDLWKLKRFMDGEARVIAVEEAVQNTNEATRDELGRTKRSSAKAGRTTGKGMVGAIIVSDPQWGELRLSPGIMTHAERIAHWETEGRSLIGARVHWRAFGYGVKDKPRFARFYGIPLDR